MYVLCSPCILDPALRAEGITRPADIARFERSQERCRRFGIEMVPLPCPETLYLGPKRAPGTFLERLNTPVFMRLLGLLEEQVQKEIQKRGKPLCILGVNSSPTCGVTATYYGCEGNLPAKRAGRGVFLLLFPGIPAIDVTEFSRFSVYLAAPLFSDAERAYNRQVAALLRNHFFEVFLPQDSSDNEPGRDRGTHSRIYESNRQALEDADVVVAIIDGADADSGTAWEMGYAAARQKPVIALRTDFRMAGHHEHVNLMLEQSARITRNAAELLAALGAPPAGNQVP